MSKTIISKTCSKCKESKPLSDFYKNCGAKDSHHHSCKICKSKYDKKYRQTERGKAVQIKGNLLYRKTRKGKAAAKRYRQSEKGKAANRRNKIHTRACYPKRIKARSAVSNAIIMGKLISPKLLICYYCPKQAQQYHHWHGYAPKHQLDIVPVCKKCHIN